MLQAYFQGLVLPVFDWVGSEAYKFTATYTRLLFLLNAV